MPEVHDAAPPPVEQGEGPPIPALHKPVALPPGLQVAGAGPIGQLVALAPILQPVAASPGPQFDALPPVLQVRVVVP